MVVGAWEVRVGIGYRGNAGVRGLGKGKDEQQRICRAESEEGSREEEEQATADLGGGLPVEVGAEEMQIPSG
jgi:hypothetical protein